MPRPRRKPRPPGNAQAVCTGRGRHKRRHIRRLQLAVDDGRVVIRWDQREGPAPVTDARSEEGWKTFDLECPVCRRRLKRREDWLIQAVIALGREQGLEGNDNTTVLIDISRVDRA